MPVTLQFRWTRMNIKYYSKTLTGLLFIVYLNYPLWLDWINRIEKKNFYLETRHWGPFIMKTKKLPNFPRFWNIIFVQTLLFAISCKTNNRCKLAYIMWTTNLVQNYNLSFGNCDPDLLSWWRHQTMNGLNFLSVNEMKLEAFDENREKYQAFSDRKTPSWALTLSSKAKRLISHAWNLLDVFWTETIRIKPDKNI